MQNNLEKLDGIDNFTQSKTHELLCTEWASRRCYDKRHDSFLESILIIINSQLADHLSRGFSERFNHLVFLQTDKEALVVEIDLEDITVVRISCDTLGLVEVDLNFQLIARVVD